MHNLMIVVMSEDDGIGSGVMPMMMIFVNRQCFGWDTSSMVQPTHCSHHSISFITCMQDLQMLYSP